jgi:tetratricopeptide (TPR) repeat protein
VLANLGRNEEALTCFDQTIQLNPNLHQAWYNWGNTLGILGRIEEALTCFDQAIHIKPDDYEAWHNRGLALANLGRNEEATRSYDRAIYIKPDYHEAWFSRGNGLKDLGQIEEALACFDQAIHIEPDDYEAWNNRGLALADLGRNEEATRSYDRAIYIKPDYHEAWSNWGIALVNLGRTQEAIASYDQAIRINPDYHVAWNNQAYELAKLGRNEEAIASYDQALEIKPDLHLAWINRGITAGNSISCDPLLAFQSAIAQQNPALNQRGYEGELASHKQGLNHCPQDTHPEGWGLLHQAIGNAHYFRGRRDSSPRPYWHKAIKSYKGALKTLTSEGFPEAHLEVLQKLIRAYSDLGETQKVEVLLGEGTDLLGRLVQEAATDAEKIRLSRKFAGFDQLRVDALAQSGNLCAALELAEQRKNLCLTWLHYGWSESVEDSPNYAQMQQLLQPSPKAPLSVQLSRGQDGQLKITLPKVSGQSVGSKAIVYWHISPAAITTFILIYKQPPLVLSAKTDLTPPIPLSCKERGRGRGSSIPHLSANL